jgi:two-component system sensor histidine kinase KdpD
LKLDLRRKALIGCGTIKPKKRNTGRHQIIKDLLYAILILTAATAASSLIVHYTGSFDNVGVIYVLAVVLISRSTAGYFWGVVSSAASVFIQNFFFTYPYRSFQVSVSGYPLTFLGMLVVSLLTSTLTVQVKEQARFSAQREKRTKSLYEFSQRLLAASGVKKIVYLTLEYLYEFSQRTVVFYTEDPQKGGTGIFRSATSRHEYMLQSRDEKAVAHQVFLTQKRAGAGTPGSTGANGLYLPVIAQGQMLGVAGLFYEKDEQPQEDRLTFINMIISQAALALERQRLSDEQQEIVVKAEKEKMRTNLLRSVSHDLRTPLTSIIGASSAILENKDLISPETHDKLIGDIHEEAGWLIRMVENLLTVTRISDSPAKVKKLPEAAEEIVAEAVSRIRSRFPDVVIHVSVPEEFLMVPMDATLIEQVIINLLENAVYHAGRENPIDLKVTVQNRRAVFCVSDRGPGIPKEQLRNIFDGYPAEKSKSSDSSRGAGIGLSICMSIVKAHQGQMAAENREDGPGAVFTFTLPLEEAESNGQ